ncbi:calcium-activated chloride channel domain-containing protein [Hirsutella rhossiliensis]|uniref:Calcium-activated chloride channel domain-containing protein n=1 Tax=Hirsutella rhossiliensis TaxID=111463 RepID=A0A9P8N4D3_9HYPO|nr:calcium-activated chloride channel domain-containing protein [Hirsutella rhossiliensis]KAH0966594.1 calcium-activated chloride channel domain-containing protein [Hirsutella rhossiliensis]
MTLKTRNQTLWKVLSAAAQRELVPPQLASALQNLTYNDKYVINYGFHDVDYDTAIQDFVALLEDLEAVGLHTEVRAGHDESLLVFVRAPREILSNAVYKSRVRDWLYGVTAVHPDSGSHSTVDARYEAEDLLSMYHLLSWPREMGGAGITPGYGLFRNVTSYFPLHNPRASGSLLRRLGKKPVLRDEDFDLIRDLFGSKAAFYFAFNQTYILFLFFPAFSGLLAWAFLPLYSWFYTILTGLWCIVFIEYWKLKETDLSIRWDVKGVGSLKTDRPPFIFEKRLVQIPFMLLATLVLGALIAMALAIEVLISEVYDGQYKSYLEYLPPTLLAIIMPCVSQFLERTATALTGFENHRTADSHEQSLAQKVFMLNFTTLYLPIFLTAFVYFPFGSLFVPRLKSFLHYIQGDTARFVKNPFHSDKNRLQREVITLTITGQITHFGEKFIIPFVKQYIRSWYRNYRVSQSAAVPIERVVQDPPEEQAFLSAARCQASLPPYDVQADISQIVLQFGYLALFSPVWPLVPIGLLINNWIELRSDFLKICIEHQRPAPLRTDGIGPWAQNLWFLTWLGSISTAAIAWWKLLITIIISEHISLAMRAVVQSAMQRIGPKQVCKESDADFVKRKKYLAKLEANKSEILGLGRKKTERIRSILMTDGNTFWTRQVDDGKSKSVGVQIIQTLRKIDKGCEKGGNGKVDS